MEFDGAVPSAGEDAEGCSGIGGGEGFAATAVCFVGGFLPGVFNEFLGGGIPDDKDFLGGGECGVEAVGLFEKLASHDFVSNP